jgi:hypothetical protein
MDLNHIKLPASVIADLYHTSLIETNEVKKEIQAEVFPSEAPISPVGQNHNGLKWLGENRKNILILGNYKNAIHLPDDEFNFLTGILGACKLNIADVAILNVNNHPEMSYKELINQLKSKIIFLFGVEPTKLGLPMSFPHFRVQPFANCSFLFSPTLKELENDKVLKSKLWVCLKRLFNL